MKIIDLDNSCLCCPCQIKYTAQFGCMYRLQFCFIKSTKKFFEKTDGQVIRYFRKTKKTRVQLPSEKMNEAVAQW